MAYMAPDEPGVIHGPPRDPHWGTVEVVAERLMREDAQLEAHPGSVLRGLVHDQLIYTILAGLVSSAPPTRVIRWCRHTEDPTPVRLLRASGYDEGADELERLRRLAASTTKAVQAVVVRCAEGGTTLDWYPYWNAGQTSAGGCPMGAITAAGRDRRVVIGGGLLLAGIALLAISIAALAALAWRHMVISPHTLGALLSAAVGGLVLVAAGAITGLWALGRHGPAPRP